MKRFLMIAMLGSMMLGGCASALKLENVTGSWTCPRIDGVCAEVSDIDAKVVAKGADHAVTAFSIGSASGAMPSGSPMRTGDEVAKIMFAPMIDANGYYLGRREIYAVMRPGGWAPPTKSIDSIREESLRRPDRPEASDER